MPQTNTAPDDAFARLWQQVHVPVFFHKLAELGLVPQSQAEADAFLRMGVQLLAAKQAAGQTKQAASPILEASNALDQALNNTELAAPQGWDDGQVKKAAAAFLARPEIAKDVELLQRAIAAAA